MDLPEQGPPVSTIFFIFSLLSRGLGMKKDEGLPLHSDRARLVDLPTYANARISFSKKIARKYSSAKIDNVLFTSFNSAFYYRFIILSMIIIILFVAILFIARHIHIYECMFF